MKIVLINGESILLINEAVSNIVKENKNVTSFDMNGCEIEDILLEAGYFSMFEEEKIIIVRNANFFGSGKLSEKDLNTLLKYLENPNDLTSIIFICNEKIDARKKITKLMKEKYEIITIPNLKYYEIENRIEKYFLKENYKIDKDTVKYIVASSLNNYDLAMSECEKIILYYNQPSFIKQEDVEQIISKSINSNNFLFVDALIENLPSISVIDPVVVPFTITEAPIRGSPTTPLTTPVTVCCENVATDINNIANSKLHFTSK